MKKINEQNSGKRRKKTSINNNELQGNQDLTQRIRFTHPCYTHLITLIKEETK
ncbi:hypothetical protein MACH09_10980 [Vibrio sp. MACH09]|nr:hypothetical protein MACH09_10980 [Vibrio sp. MACH09]